MSRRRFKVVLYGETNGPVTEEDIRAAVEMGTPSTVDTKRHASVRIRWGKGPQHVKEVCICCDEDCGKRTDAHRREALSKAKLAKKAMERVIQLIEKGGKVTTGTELNMLQCAIDHAQESWSNLSKDTGE